MFLQEFKMLFDHCSYVWKLCTSSQVNSAFDHDQSIEAPNYLRFADSFNQDDDVIIKIIPKLKCSIYQNEIFINYFISILKMNDQQFVYLLTNDENNFDESKNNKFLAYTIIGRHL